MSELQYWIGFSVAPGIGSARLALLRETFGSLAAAWEAPVRDLQAAGLDAKTAEALADTRAKTDLDAHMRRLDRLGIRAFALDDPAYPARLREIYGPPIVLYVLGELKPEDEWSVAVVGTRRPTGYGREMTERIVAGLARTGVTVISGLARGIDSQAHRAALDAGGRTIAVLGSGVDVIYPSENARLAQEVIRNGALLSEYPPGTRPDARNFPVRNRIISGLALGTLVVEAGRRSGALITSGFALEQGREVFAVPGSALSLASEGTNNLIQQAGAKLTVNAEDILQELNVAQMPQQLELRPAAPDSPSECQLANLLRAEPLHIDELVRQSGLAAAEVGATLTMMELKGLVRDLGGNLFAARY